MNTDTTMCAESKAYGRGYHIVNVVGCCLVFASFIAMFRADSDFARLRALGLVLLSFGGLFAFATVYIIATDKPLRWRVSGVVPMKTGLFDRRNTPGAFWMTMIFLATISCALLVSGAWISTRADSIAAKRSHSTAKP